MGCIGHITPGGRRSPYSGYKAGEFTTLDLHQLIGRDLRVLPVNMQRTDDRAGAVGQALADIAPARVRPELEMLPRRTGGGRAGPLAAGTADRRVLLDLGRF